MTKEAAKEILGEYVKVATALLAEEYGNDYTPNAVAQLADQLITVDQNAALEKEAQMIRRYAFEQELAKSAAAMAAITDAIKSVGRGIKTQGIHAFGGGEVGLLRADAAAAKAGGSEVAEKALRSKALKLQAKGALLTGAPVLATGALAGTAL